MLSTGFPTETWLFTGGTGILNAKASAMYYILRPSQTTHKTTVAELYCVLGGDLYIALYISDFQFHCKPNLVYLGIDLVVLVEIAKVTISMGFYNV